MSWFFLLQSCEWSGTFYAFCANESVYVRGNNREIPFVGVVSVIRTGLYPCQLIVCDQFRGGGGGGGGALRYIGGPHLHYVFCGRRGLFLRPPHVRDFVKEGYFFVPRYEVWGVKFFFWPEISAYGVFLNFDNERMRPPLNLGAPTPRPTGWSLWFSPVWWTGSSEINSTYFPISDIIWTVELSPV